MTFSFSYTSGTTLETVQSTTIQTMFFNLKNKAAGARRYGFVARVVKATNPLGEVAFRSDYQTTLDGSRYQSSKYGNWMATEAEAAAALAKTTVSAMNRYARLAQDPANRIERRA